MGWWWWRWYAINHSLLVNNTKQNVKHATKEQRELPPTQQKDGKKRNKEKRKRQIRRIHRSTHLYVPWRFANKRTCLFSVNEVYTSLSSLVFWLKYLSSTVPGIYWEKKLKIFRSDPFACYILR